MEVETKPAKVNQENSHLSNTHTLAHIQTDIDWFGSPAPRLRFPPTPSNGTQLTLSFFLRIHR